MKKILLIALIALGISAKAQITLEHDYDSASTITHGVDHSVNQLMVVNFEVSGYCYVKINRWAKSIEIYSLNHSLLKTIDCSGLPLNQGLLGNFIYFSEQLFNMDSKIEFLYGFVDGSGTSDTYYTGIYNEDGDLLFSDTAGVPIVMANIPQQQYPIYNTSNGTKMILSYSNGHAKVFSLPGTLTTGIQEGNAQLVQAQGGQFSNLFPNPNSGTVTLQYELPKGETEGEIILYNQQGTEVKRYKVDNTFNDVILDNTQLTAGTYFYQLLTSEGIVGVKKMIVIN